MRASKGSLRKGSLVLLFVLLWTSLRSPTTSAITIQMEKGGEYALAGYILLYIFTAGEPDPLYTSRDVNVTMRPLNLPSHPEQMYVIETAVRNVSATIHFFVIRDGTALKFGVIGFDVVENFLWVELPVENPNLSPDNWTWQRFEISTEEV